MAWVGGANEASGATKTLSGVLNGVAGNIDNVATAAGALVAVGVARYFGNMASGAVSATAGLVTAARNEVALAEAQLRGRRLPRRGQGQPCTVHSRLWRQPAGRRCRLLQKPVWRPHRNA